MTSISLPSGKISEATISDAKKMARHLAGRSSGDSATNLRTYTPRMAEDDAKAAWLLNALLAALSVPTPGTGGAEDERRRVERLAQEAGVADGNRITELEGMLAEAEMREASWRETALSTPQAGDLGVVKLDGPELWEIVFGVLKGDVPEELTDDVFAKIAAAINSAFPLSSTPVGEMDGWQSMDSAPKDGRNVLLCFHHHPVAIGRFEYGSWTYAFCVTDGGDSPTGWMPVPRKRRPNMAAEHTEGGSASPQGGR